jgi:glyoxylase-like metal-dependent hydrolase (beta-lactamase superfamily II)
MPAEILGFFDPDTSTVSYLVADPASREAAIIDSVLDFDPKAARTTTVSADRLIAEVARRGLKVTWILETHAHADHLSAAPYLKQKLGGRIAIGEHIRDTQKIFAGIFHLGPDFVPDGSQFDHLFRAGETFRIGGLEAKALFTPGHTPADISYLVGDAAFIGDTLFMPDYGTARADFPGGDARILYRSIRQLLDLPGETRLFTGHDYLPGGRAAAWESTVAEQRRTNIHVRDGISEEEFVAMRTERDAGLDKPRLILPSVQVNIRAGHLPPAEANGVSYLKLPVNLL